MGIGDDRNNAEILHGWKNIEKYIGLNRKTILRQGYPVKKLGTGSVHAIREELLKHAMQSVVIGKA